MPESFIGSLPDHIYLKSNSKDRKDYVYHPPTGESIDDNSVDRLKKLRKSWRDTVPDVQIIISDGLNVNAITDEGHLKPYLEKLKTGLTHEGFSVSDTCIVFRYGRVRAGYRCGEYLFGQGEEEKKAKGIVHIIGERPGSEHHNFSAYLSAPLIRTWKKKGRLDHDLSKVVSGISDTALHPEIAATETVKILKGMFADAVLADLQ